MQRSLYTIGYEGSGIGAFVATLLQAGIATLIDVRDVALSRKPGFSKSALAASLEAHGVGYLHLRGLGDPKPGRLAARAGDYERFRQIFGRHMRTDAARHDLGRAIEAVRAQPCCLMCFEQDPCHCHRAIVADHIVKETGMRLEHLSTKRLACIHERSAALSGVAAA